MLYYRLVTPLTIPPNLGGGRHKNHSSRAIYNDISVAQMVFELAAANRRHLPLNAYPASSANVLEIIKNYLYVLICVHRRRRRRRINQSNTEVAFTQRNRTENAMRDNSGQTWKGCHRRLVWFGL